MIEHSTPQVLNMRQVLGEVVTASYDDDYYKSQYAILQNESSGCSGYPRTWVVQQSLFQRSKSARADYSEG